MSDNQGLDSLYQELLNDFKTESAEHYETIVQGLFNLTSGESTSISSIIETIYRSTHSLKGAARAVSLAEVEKVCSALESVFGKIKNSEIEITTTLLDNLHDFTDLLKELLNNTNNSSNSHLLSKTSRAVKNLEYLVQSNLANIQKDKTTREDKVEHNLIEDNISSDSINDNINDNINDKSYEGDINDKSYEGNINDKFYEGNINDNSYDQTHRTVIDTASVRISTEHLNTILTQTESFVAIKNNLEHYRKELEEIYNVHREPHIYNLLRDLTDFHTTVTRMTDDLTANIRNTLLSSFDTLLKLLPKMVRDLSKEYSKEIIFKTEGAFVEIDRRILEQLKDPLIHLLRNSIDHGIELPQERIKVGKNKVGTILIRVEKLPEQIVKIIIEDDGAGIDKAKIIECAIKKGIITPEKSKSLRNEEIYELIFQSGVSSTKFVTDISGRGLGMTIVADKIATLGGSIDTETTENIGTKFTISLPQSITTFRGVLVNCCSQELIIPSQYVKGIRRAFNSEVSTIGNRSVIKDSLGNNVGLVRLSSVIGIEEPRRVLNINDFFYLVYLEHKNNTIAYIVDSVSQEYEGILKNMGPQLSYAKNIIGVTIIKNEVVVPVINVKEVLENTIFKADISLNNSIDVTSEMENSITKVLIAEDSFTIRSMLRNMVENAGYQVTTAIDGQDALAKLKSDFYDILVTDIEMPNLNGFELTHRVKTNPSLKEMPVILVTALESPTDMKKGMDSGADAYIVKSNFEKSNLIETIKRLL